jgi:predicted membrane channel-forming protein YqfA (hemolysin III family)
MNKELPALRVLAVATGLAVLGLGVGYALNEPWATATWPWPDGGLSHLFVGSILTAFAVAFVWIGAVGEWGALSAGAITVLVMCAGFAAYLFTLEGTRSDVLASAVWFAALAGISGLAFFWARRRPIHDTRTIPPFLRVSFGVFVVVLVVFGSALILRAPVFPWPLNPDSSVMFGCIFLADACYFLFSLLDPRWNNARGQLLSFLAYDLVLIPPLLALFATVRPGHLLSLVLYLTVLFYSAGLAVYYLFVDGKTRSWAIHRA